VQGARKAKMEQLRLLSHGTGSQPLFVLGLDGGDTSILYMALAVILLIRNRLSFNC